ncbi:MAG: TIGR03643 family protein [Saprospiraceae bacterium]|nr:TIGR03643 family protein [Saprospiraceae bacterium]
MSKKKLDLPLEDIDRIVEMAWEDRTPFDAIQTQFGLAEGEVIRLMRREMKASSFRMWRARVQGRKTKHSKQRSEDVGRFKCSRQKQISNNKMPKR